MAPTNTPANETVVTIEYLLRKGRQKRALVDAAKATLSAAM